MTAHRRPIAKASVMRPVGRRANEAYRTREHLTEEEVSKLLAALRANRHGHRDWPIGLLIYRHGLRVSEACDLRWDDIDLAKRTIIVRRLKGSDDSTHYLERDELAGLRALQRHARSVHVFLNERGHPFNRAGISRMIERAGKAAKLGIKAHAHMLRHSTGYALAAKGMDTRRLQHYLGHASITNTGALYRDVAGTVQGYLALAHRHLYLGPWLRTTPRPFSFDAEPSQKAHAEPLSC